MLENLIKFLSDNGVEVPEGADKDSILNIISALLGVESSDSSEEESTESVEPTVNGVA